MATSKIQVTEGSGKNVATYSITEDAVTKEIGRQTVSRSDGSEVFTDVSLATQSISAQDTASTSSTGANSQSIITGTPTTSSVASFTLTSWSTTAIMVSGTWTGTLAVEGSFDGGTSWISKAVKQVGTGYVANNLTGNFAGEVNTSTLTNIRVRSTAAWTGTATVLIRVSTSNHSVYLANAVKLQDGVTQSVQNTIKAASAAAATTDTSIVVQESPNSALFTTGISSRITNGTNTADVVAGDSGYNGIVTNVGAKTIQFTTSGTGAQILVANTSTRGYASAIMVFDTLGTGFGTNLQYSPTSGGTYRSVSTSQILVNNTALSTAGFTNVAAYYSFPVLGDYFQLNVTAITAGTATGYIYFTNAAQLMPNLASTSGLAPAAPILIATQNSGGQLGVIGNASQVLDASAASLSVGVVQSSYNNSSWDRLRNNTSAAVIAAGATTAQTSATQVTYNASKLLIAINISAFTSGSLTFTINGITSSGYTYLILASSAQTATTSTPLLLRIFPASTPSANAVTNDQVPRSYNVVVSGTFVATYGVDYALSL